MDQITKYRKLIRRIMAEIAEDRQRDPATGTETELLVDTERDNYMILYLGWEATKRVQYIVAFVRLRNGKIWIEDDWTEDGIVAYLERAGVPNKDIVLAFNPPEMRQFTEFAVA